MLRTAAEGRLCPPTMIVCRQMVGTALRALAHPTGFAILRLIAPPARQVAAGGNRVARVGFRPTRHVAMLGRGRLQSLLDRGGTMQVGLEGCGVLTEALPVDLQILHHPLDVIARLREWNALDPVHRVDLW